MNRKFFWLVNERTKFRVVFEDCETVLGVNRNKEHRVFRKDTGVIAFSKPKRLRNFAKIYLEQKIADQKSAVERIGKNFIRKQPA